MKVFTAKMAREAAEFRMPSKSVMSILYDIEQAANDGQMYIYAYTDYDEEDELIKLGYKVNRPDKDDEWAQICWENAR